MHKRNIDIFLKVLNSCFSCGTVNQPETSHSNNLQDISNKLSAEMAEVTYILTHCTLSRQQDPSVAKPAIAKHRHKCSLRVAEYRKNILDIFQ